MSSRIKHVMAGAVLGALLMFLGIVWIANAPDGNGMTTGTRFAVVLFVPMAGVLGGSLGDLVYTENKKQPKEGE